VEPYLPDEPEAELAAGFAAGVLLEVEDDDESEDEDEDEAVLAFSVLAFSELDFSAPDFSGLELPWPCLPGFAPGLARESVR
jgi:hypothetical protein